MGSRTRPTANGAASSDSHACRIDESHWISPGVSVEVRPVDHTRGIRAQEPTCRGIIVPRSIVVQATRRVVRLTRIAIRIRPISRSLNRPPVDIVAVGRIHCAVRRIRHRRQAPEPVPMGVIVPVGEGVDPLE